MAKVLVTFANGSKYERKRRINSITAKHIGRFDRVIEYTLNDIEETFKVRNKEILQLKKGVGLWLWKPYFIHKALSTLDDNDILFYCDSASVFIRPIENMVQFMFKENLCIMPFILPFEERHWTSEGAMLFFDMSENQRNSNQVCASFLLMKKTSTSVRFIEDWLLNCQKYELITGKFQGVEEPNLIEHRYDQSILSMVIKKRGLTMYRDPSQYGSLPALYGKYHQINLDYSPRGDYRSSIILIRSGSFIRACLDYALNYIKWIIQ